jgi:hypothetical protein
MTRPLALVGGFPETARVAAELRVIGMTDLAAVRTVVDGHRVRSPMGISESALLSCGYAHADPNTGSEFRIDAVLARTEAPRA